MWWPFSKKNPDKKPDAIIGRNDLRLLIFHQCGRHSAIPLNKKYKLVQSKAWVRRRTPEFSKWIEDFDDCNHRALKAVASAEPWQSIAAMEAMQTHCLGMVVVETSDPDINHVLNLVVMEDKVVLFYDPSNLEFSEPSEWGKVVATWI